MIVIDFETHAITKLQPFPRPVGVALLSPSRPKGAYIRGSLKQIREAIVREMRAHRGDDIIFHNGVGFDIGVARVHLDLEFPVERVNDTLVLAWLDDPYRRLALKDLAHRLLGIPPEEQQDLRAWILSNIPEARKSPRNWGAWIASAPPPLVEPYAIGDVVRTAKLFKELASRVKADGMWPAYRREIATTPMLLDSYVRGIPVDRVKLSSGCRVFGATLEKVDDRLRKLLRAPQLELDSGAEVADCIKRRFNVRLPRTATGRMKTDVATLADVLPTGEPRSLLLYRSALAQDLRTFIQPWLAMSKDDGRLRTHWNLVGGTGRTGGGTRTGRLSSEPNLQNLTSTERREALVERLGKPPEWLRSWALPVVRSYILPEKGELLIGRDYSQQELRLMAHFENSTICERYNKDPSLDVHDLVGAMIKSITGVTLPRKIIKILNFCTIYGGGSPAIARQGGMSLEEANTVRSLYFRAMPTVKELMRDTQDEGRAGFITTIGGRIYEVEHGIDDVGRPRDLAYKLLNYRIQGSAADQMKEALVQLWEQRKLLDGASFKLTVHDELLFSSPKRTARKSLKAIDRIMVGTAKTFKLRVPFLTDGYMGRDWASVVKEKGL